MTLGKTAVRAVIGGLFVGHGTQKLFGWFGGHGREGTAQFFESLGLRPGRRHATLAGAAEAGGGALLALGLLTPLATSSLIGVMTTAIRTVHGPKGPWVTEGGWEYNAVLIATLVALTEAGPGSPSLDHALGIDKRGLGWGLAALGAGVGGATLALRMSEGQAQPPAPEQSVPSGDPATVGAMSPPVTA